MFNASAQSLIVSAWPLA